MPWNSEWQKIWWFGLVVWDSKLCPWVIIPFIRGSQESKPPTQTTNLPLVETTRNMRNTEENFNYPPGRFNSSPPKSYLPNREVVFQPPFFQGLRSMLNFEGGKDKCFQGVYYSMTMAKIPPKEMPPYEGLRNQMITVSLCLKRTWVETPWSQQMLVLTYIWNHLDKTHHVSVRLKTKPPHVFSCLPPPHLLQNLCHRRMTNLQQTHLTHQGMYLPRWPR